MQRVRHAAAMLTHTLPCVTLANNGTRRCRRLLQLLLLFWLYATESTRLGKYMASGVRVGHIVSLLLQPLDKMCQLLQMWSTEISSPAT